MATATTNAYAPNAERAKFRERVSEMMRKRKDPNYVKFALEQVGYDTSVIDEELGRIQNVQTGQPVQKNANAIPGEGIDQMNLTGQQQTALLYGQRLYTSGKILDNFDEGIAKKDFLGSVKQKAQEAAVGGTITNQFVDPEFQQYDQAKRDFINATLRRESGAVISDAEFDNANKQYFPRPGDDEKTIAQKKANRELIAKGFLKSAGVQDSEINFQDQQTQQGKVSLNSPEEAAKWLQDNPNDPGADIVRKKLESVGYKSPDSMQSTTQNPSNSSIQPTAQDMVEPEKRDKMFSDLRKAGDFLGITKFAQGIGTTLFLQSSEGKKLQKDAENGDKNAIDALNQILQEAPSAKEVIGSAALTALNVATAGSLPGGGATSAVGKIAQGTATGYAYDVAGDLQNDKSLKEVATPGIGTVAGATLSTIGVITNALGKGGQKTAERIYNSAVPPTLEDTKKAILYNGKTLGREALDRGLTGGKEKLFVKATQGVTENERKLQEILKNSDGVITREEVTPFLEKLKEKLSKTPTPSAQKALQSVDEAVKLLPETMTVSEANVLKRNIYSQIGDVAYKLDANLKGEAENSKAIASGLKSLIEKKSGSTEVAALNKEIAIHDKVRESVVDQIARTMRNKLAGVGTIGSLIEKTIGATSVKTYGAAVIDKAAKKLAESGSGTASKITKVMIMNALREAQGESNQ